jgi:hypothetical protein
MRLYWIWFSLLSGLNPRTQRILLARFSDPEELYHANSHTLSSLEGLTSEDVQALENKDLTESRKILEQCQKGNIGIFEHFPCSVIIGCCFVNQCGTNIKKDPSYIQIHHPKAFQ